jgi:hypothetical protein
VDVRRPRLPVADAVVGAQLLWKLPAFLRDEMGLEEARASMHRRLERRQADLLALALNTIYGCGSSPYRRLLEKAGCEYGDLERLVRMEGWKGALAVLLRQGVYLTGDEFKGHRPALRGNAQIEPAASGALDGGRAPGGRHSPPVHLLELWGATLSGHPLSGDRPRRRQADAGGRTLH